MIQDILDYYPLPVKDFGDKAVLLNHMLFLHGVAAASTPLLEQAIAKSEPGELRDYFAAHLEEERSHLGWLEADMATECVTPLAVHWHAAAVGGAQAYATERIGPVSLLGYMAVMEGRPTPLEYIEVLERLHGKPLLRTIRYHAINDIDHGAAIHEQIAKLNDNDKQIVRDSAARTAWLLSWGY